MPVTKVVLKLVAGSQATLGTVQNLCTTKARKATANLTVLGQNGTKISSHPTLHVNGCPKPKKTKKH